MMSIKTSHLKFKPRINEEIQNDIMRKAVVMAQERIGANRQKMVEELGHWEEWREHAKEIRNHVIENLDAYLYQLSESDPKWWSCVFCDNSRRSHKLH